MYTILSILGAALGIYLLVEWIDDENDDDNADSEPAGETITGGDEGGDQAILNGSCTGLIGDEVFEKLHSSTPTYASLV